MSIGLLAEGIFFLSRGHGVGIYHLLPEVYN